MPEWLDEFDVPSVAVTVLRDNEIAFTAVYGEQASGVPATGRTRYDVASLTKPVVAEVVLRLVSEGRLSLDEPMAPYWVDPDVAGDVRHRALTPRHVLTHQTGLPNWRSETGGTLQFMRDPGAGSGYSSEGFNYLLRFVERKLDAPFESLAEDVLFTPSEMRSTSFTSPPEAEDLAVRYLGGAFAGLPTRSEPSGATGLVTTSADYARFVLDVMSGAGGSGAIAEDRFGVRADRLADACPPGEFEPETCPEAAGYGLGWYLFEYPEETVVYHTGGVFGYKALAFFVPERGLGAVFLSNGERGRQVIHRMSEVLYDNDDWLRIVKPTDPFGPPVLALDGHDPVLLVRGQEIRGADSLVVEHEGYRYAFASEANRALFLDAPERFGIQLRGACAAMASTGAPPRSGDPSRFTVYNERVYIFATNACRERFEMEPERYLAPEGLEGDHE